MPRSYTKVEELAAAVFERKAKGETNRQIAESYGPTQTQIEQLVNRQNRKRKKLEAGIVVRPKGRPPKMTQTAEVAVNRASAKDAPSRLRVEMGSISMRQPSSMTAAKPSMMICAEDKRFCNCPI